MKRTNCEFVGRVDEKGPGNAVSWAIRGYFRENFPLVIPAEACSWSLNHSPLEVRRCCLKAGVGSVYLITDTSSGMHHVGSAYAIQGAFSGGGIRAFSKHVFEGDFPGVFGREMAGEIPHRKTGGSPSSALAPGLGKRRSPSHPWDVWALRSAAASPLAVDLST